MRREMYESVESIYPDLDGWIFLKGSPSLPRPSVEQLQVLASANADPPGWPQPIIWVDGDSTWTSTSIPPIRSTLHWATGTDGTHPVTLSTTAPKTTDSVLGMSTATTTVTSSAVTAMNALATSEAEDVVWATEWVTVTV